MKAIYVDMEHDDGTREEGNRVLVRAAGVTIDIVADPLIVEALDYYREDLRYRLNTHGDTEFGQNDRHAAWAKVDRLDALVASMERGS